MTRARGAEEGTGGAGACRDEAAQRDPVRRSSRSAPTGAKPRSGPVGFCRRGFRVAHPPGSPLVCGPGSRSLPRPWGRGGRPCWRRQKRRRCESSGLWAPFLCPETESGVEGGRRSACRVFELPTPPLSRTCSDTRAVTSEDSSSFFLQAISSCPGKKKKTFECFGNGFFPLHTQFWGLFVCLFFC